MGRVRDDDQKGQQSGTCVAGVFFWAVKGKAHSCLGVMVSSCKAAGFGNENSADIYPFLCARALS